MQTLVNHHHLHVLLWRGGFEGGEFEGGGFEGVGGLSECWGVLDGTGMLVYEGIV